MHVDQTNRTQSQFKTQVCSCCGETKVLDDFPYDKRGKSIWYRKKCRQCKEESSLLKLPSDLRKQLVEIEKSVKAQHVTKIAFEALEHPEDPKRVAVLVSNVHAVMSAFVRYQDAIRQKFGNIEITEESDEDGFHSVAGEELDLPENKEGIY